MNAKLPLDYLEFMAATNGGLAVGTGDDLFVSFLYNESQKPKPQAAILRCIFPIGSPEIKAKGDIIGVEECLINLRIAESGFPGNLLPVAQSDCGMILGMYLGGDKNRYVHAFSSDYGFTEGGYHVSNSFREFVDGVFLRKW